MAKGKKSNKMKKAAGKDPVEESPASKILEQIEAMSSDESDASDNDDTPGTRELLVLDKSGDQGESEELNAEARALRQAIAEGAFDKLAGLTSSGAVAVEEGNTVASAGEEAEDDDDDEESEREETGQKNPEPDTPSHKALIMKVDELQSHQNRMPWPERFSVTPLSALPFQDKASRLDVHDDLKREVAFYDLALEAVQVAKAECNQHKIPFSRPEDFFAEMVKTDDHMAKVKDRLIFESKKIAAVEQRKANKQHKVRAKEVHQTKIAEKNQRKKQHMDKVADWAKSAAKNRGNARDDNEDDAYLKQMSGGKTSSSKRTAADRKYGRPGKKKRGNDKEGLNDMRDYNKKHVAAKRATNAKNKRPGKKSRDAARTKTSRK